MKKDRVFQFYDHSKFVALSTYFIYIMYRQILYVKYVQVLSVVKRKERSSHELSLTQSVAHTS